MLSLCEFLDQALTAYHTVAMIRSTLLAKGYTELCEADSWELSLGGKYFVIRNDSSLIAWQIPRQAPAGFLMASAHGDSPAFKIKKSIVDANYTRLATERYGGMLVSTWFDRPLKVAGRVMVEKNGMLSSQTVELSTPVVIPSVAIHMQKDAAGGFQNLAVDLLPLAGGKDADAAMEAELRAQVDGRILARDLFVVPATPAFLWGKDGEYISAPRLDDLQCVHALLDGFVEAEPKSHIAVLAIFDNEEVGSKTMQGADSTFLKDVLERTAQALSQDADAYRRWVAGGFMISADNAHAVHPAHPELTDGHGGSCYLNGGVVIKHNAMQKYTTDARSEAILLSLCRALSLPVQSFTNRADKLGGSTLGNLSAAHVAVPSVDIGLPQLSMHSAMETAGTADSEMLTSLITAYYSAVFSATAEGFFLKIE